jgi:2-oxo-4-hydroxy-4-carboxy-5-ureidoimidazoline decarboxylase
VSDTLARWNRLPAPKAEEEILPCCGSRAWARAMVSRRPITREAMLLTVSDQTWRALGHEDWMEAFRSHPRIGESRPVGQNATTEMDRRSGFWSAREQSGVAESADSVRKALAEANRAYESRFGHTFIVCASGKESSEILNILCRRLRNDASTELQEAAEEQRQITHIRLKRWLAE